MRAMPAEDARSTYRNPLVERYASREMAAIFSDRAKFGTWRRIWLALAEAEQELGLPITDAQLGAMRSKLDLTAEDFANAEAEERRRRHDVMAHVHAFGLAAPEAKAILHLGATSADVGDNADLIAARAGLRLVARRLVSVIEALARFAKAHRSLACLGATHLQPAQPTTVGKRACLWIQDFAWDLEAVVALADTLPLRGIKGTTGTQGSYLELFEGDETRVRELDRRVTERLGFARAVPVSGQTYSRKLDARIVEAVAAIGESAGKMSCDVRLLQAFGEIAEPFGRDQTGSSAMAYKRNPMRSERTASLARYLLALPQTMAQTAASQWLERTLDDSAIRRIALPESFLAADAILVLVLDVARGLEVFPRVIERRLADELPFMATEVVIMEGVKAGGDRQDLHEAIRSHAHEASRRVREDGASNDLFERLERDPLFAAVRPRLAGLRDPALFVGCAPRQVDVLLEEHVEPLLARVRGQLAAWGDAPPADAEVRV
jgi:adenylosuccinate lyase